MDLRMNGNKITINGREFSGSSVTIKNDKVVIDGVVQEGSFGANISVIVYGDVETLSNTSGDVTVGNAGSIQTVSGDVECGDVDGSVKTVSGDVNCGVVMGDVDTVSGDINNE